MKKILRIGAILLSTITATLAVPNEKDLLKKIQDYLNGVKSLQADMVQVNPNESQQKGRIYLRRDPNQTYGKLRLEYQPPATDLIVVDGEELKHKDLKSKEVNSYGVDDTPAAFLLKKNLRFGEDMDVQSVVQEGSRVKVKLVHRGDSQGMSLTLDFTTAPFLKLVGWQVYDGQGNHTAVSLDNVQIDIQLKDSLFKMD
jgi:outer membrane lipoprotein-sorting protein